MNRPSKKKRFYLVVLNSLIWSPTFVADLMSLLIVAIDVEAASHCVKEIAVIRMQKFESLLLTLDNEPNEVNNL